MTATPIPRTLALTVYGDLAVSRDLRAAREPQAGRDRVGDRGAERRGLRPPLPPPRRRAARPTSSARSSRARRRRSPARPRGRRSGCGRTSSRATGSAASTGGSRPPSGARVMTAFKRGELDVLVATTVIEVGVDVPNATIMIVQEADRFGLAQLHQLRGRVGRGAEQSYCLLVSRQRDELSESALERLEAMVATTDGFELAERDLEIRGEGQLVGARQSGLTDLRFTRLRARTATCSSGRRSSRRRSRASRSWRRPPTGSSARPSTWASPDRTRSVASPRCGVLRGRLHRRARRTSRRPRPPATDAAAELLALAPGHAPGRARRSRSPASRGSKRTGTLRSGRPSRCSGASERARRRLRDGHCSAHFGELSAVSLAARGVAGGAIDGRRPRHAVHRRGGLPRLRAVRDAVGLDLALRVTATQAPIEIGGVGSTPATAAGTRTAPSSSHGVAAESPRRGRAQGRHRERDPARSPRRHAAARTYERDGTSRRLSRAARAAAREPRRRASSADRLSQRRLDRQLVPAVAERHERRDRGSTPPFLNLGCRFSGFMHRTSFSCQPDIGEKWPGRKPPAPGSRCIFVNSIETLLGIKSDRLDRFPFAMGVPGRHTALIQIGGFQFVLASRPSP